MMTSKAPESELVYDRARLHVWRMPRDRPTRERSTHKSLTLVSCRCSPRFDGPNRMRARRGGQDILLSGKWRKKFHSLARHPGFPKYAKFPELDTIRRK